MTKVREAEQISGCLGFGFGGMSDHKVIVCRSLPGDPACIGG